MKVVEMFTGIGSQAKALAKISKKRELDIDITMTCEWNIHAIVAYHLIHNQSPVSDEILSMSKNDLISELSTYKLSSDGKKPITFNYLKSIKVEILKYILHSVKSNNNLLDIRTVKGHDIPEDTDLLTYSFPCQDLSNVGSFHGYKNGIDKDKNTRSGLLWEIERILEEKKALNQNLPKFLLLENVTALEATRHSGNFQQWKDKLESFGYVNKVYKLNSEDFGVPQYRKRLIMLSVFIGDNETIKNQVELYWKQNDLNEPNYVTTLDIDKNPLSSYLKLDYTNPIYYQEALEAQPNLTKSRLKIWNNNSKILDENLIMNKRVQTITTRQDRHPNSGNLYFDVDNSRAKFRFLTARECFLLMGFDETDYEMLIDNNMISRGKSLFFSRDAIYKLAGNSIVVDVLEAVFDQVLDINRIISLKKQIIKGITKRDELQ